MSQDEVDLKRVSEVCDKLMEHFDSVQIFCTRYSPELEGTVNVQFGRGNWFARFGQVQVWLVKEEQGERNQVAPEN